MQQENDYIIPEDWKAHVSVSFRRIYISPASGCSVNCGYCFIFEYGHPRKPILFTATGLELITWLKKQKGFTKGRNGTLISISPSTEPFLTDSITEKTLEIIGALSVLENPIQISTKKAPSFTLLTKISALQKLEGQITIFFTITSITNWKMLEPGADPPHKRFESMTLAKQSGINTCLYMKPVIPGITDVDMDEFVEKIKHHNIDCVVVGTMYISNQIEKEIEKRKLSTTETKSYFINKGRVPPPAHTEDDKLLAVQISDFTYVREIVEYLKKYSTATILINGPCAVALFYKTLSPTGIWLYRPELCVNCSAKCPTVFAIAPKDIKELYPQKNNPLPQN